MKAAHTESGAAVQPRRWLSWATQCTLACKAERGFARRSGLGRLAAAPFVSFCSTSWRHPAQRPCQHRTAQVIRAASQLPSQRQSGAGQIQQDLSGCRIPGSRFAQVAEVGQRHAQGIFASVLDDVGLDADLASLDLVEQRPRFAFHNIEQRLHGPHIARVDCGFCGVVFGSKLAWQSRPNHWGPRSESAVCNSCYADANAAVAMARRATERFGSAASSRSSACAAT